MNCRILILVVSLPFAAGCMHIPLRNNTANQARSVTDLYQQEVMNNLAMFVYDANSLPHFSYANQGATSIADQGTVGISSLWSRGGSGTLPFLFNSLGTNASAQRSALESFVMTPVNDPRKLELMRCAYQKVIAGCRGGEPSTTCPDCQTRFKMFYTGSADGNIGEKTNGAVTSDCLGSKCWFGCGCKKCKPKHCPCNRVGEYCGTYVWLLPGGQDELSKLTLAVLDYAIHDPPVEVQKQVTYFIDERGIPTTQSTAVGQVMASVGVTERVESLMNVPRTDEVTIRDELQKELEEVEREIARQSHPTARPKEANDNNGEHAKEHAQVIVNLMQQEQMLQKKLNYLNQQLKVGGLKQEYIRLQAPTSGSILNLNQIQSVTPGPGFGSGFMQSPF